VTRARAQTLIAPTTASNLKVAHHFLHRIYSVASYTRALYLSFWFHAIMSVSDELWELFEFKHGSRRGDLLLWKNEWCDLSVVKFIYHICKCTSIVSTFFKSKIEILPHTYFSCFFLNFFFRKSFVVLLWYQLCIAWPNFYLSRQIILFKKNNNANY
jgi:hypothetical protein